MSEERVRQDLTGVEAALSSLTPTPTGVDRDRVMYLAGRAAAGGSLDLPRRRAWWLWPSATAASLLLAVTFAAMWHARGEPVVVYRDRPVAAPQPAEQPRVATEEKQEVEGEVAIASPGAPWRTDYLQLRRLVTMRGIDALPESRAAPASHVETLRWGSGFDRALAEFLEG
ncbi:MAG TPA: hypothetical protein VMY37_39925 [Thermoguttaceae bacterium]|nr:hypothetical protein [Thermoguttaceae bacterium]